jgi:[ribosomal protein S5]-alanine N-acetyltransferase
MTKNTIFETDRLIMKPIETSDTNGLFRLDNNANVMKYLGNKIVTDIQYIHDKIDRIQNEYQKYNIGRFSVFLKENNEFIGWSGIQFVTEEENNHINYYDLGYRLLEEHWGKGYGYECALPWVNYAKETMKIDVLTAGAHVDNIGSNKILQKVGMHFVNEYNWKGNPWNWYEMELNK